MATGSPTSPHRITALSGRVSSGRTARGSKSEREAVFIDTDAGRYVLRRKNGPVFGDDALRRYVGHTVECDGFVLGNTVLSEDIRITG